MTSTDKTGRAGPKLTKAQRNALEAVASYQPTERWPNAAYFAGRTYDSLIARGLIERCDQTGPLGGSGPIGKVSITWRMCRLTEAGRAAITLADGGSDGE